MSDDHKIRFCEGINCNVRMSALSKDQHVLCPNHTGWQCNWERRCSVCKDWTDQQMQDYMRLQEGKARRKAHKDRKRELKLAAGRTSEDGRPAHSLSPSSGSSVDLGEIVSSPLLDKALHNLNLTHLGDGNIVSNRDSVSIDEITPSVFPLPSRLGDSGYVGQVSAVPHRQSMLASKGNGDPAPWMDAGENPSCVGQPLQKLAPFDVEREYATPSTSVASGRSRLSSSSLRLTPGVYNTLKGVLEKHKQATDKEKMRLMLDSLMDIDPSFSGSASSRKSRRSRRSSGRSDRTDRSRSEKREERVKPTVEPTQISISKSKDEQLEVLPVDQEQRSSEVKVVETRPLLQVELRREWARMVETGGVKVREGVSCYFKDKEGNPKFVVPPTRSLRQAGNLGQKLGRTALSAVTGFSSAEDVAPGIEETVPQFQGLEGGKFSKGIAQDVILSPRCQVSPRRDFVSPCKVSEETQGRGGELFRLSQATWD